MRYSTVAFDYDGTLAHDGEMAEATVDALQRCQQSGRKLIMVTGRELPDLQNVCSHLYLFERIVVENGALLYRADTGEEKALGPPPSAEFLATLQRRGVEPCTMGRVIVSTKHPHEKVVLETIRDLGLELQVIFNKGAVMVLPSGINKAIGLKAVLKELNLSAENVVAIGDAENDHALLESCALGVAVANAVSLLKAHADWVTDDKNGLGVKQLIERLLQNDLADLHPKQTTEAAAS